MAGQETVHSVCGPMARSLDGLIAFAKALTSPLPSAQATTEGKYQDQKAKAVIACELDPKVIDMPWRQEAFVRALEKPKLRIAMVRHNMIVR